MIRKVRYEGWERGVGWIGRIRLKFEVTGYERGIVKRQSGTV